LRFGNIDYESFKALVENKRKECRANLENVRLAIMLWGEDLMGENPKCRVRQALKVELEKRGHYVKYGEEVCDAESKYSYIGQLAAEARAFDLILSIPTSIGSASEAHSFFMVPRVSEKLIIFIDEHWETEGFSGPSLYKLQSQVTAAVKLYNDDYMQKEILEASLKEINKIQEARVYFGKTIF